MNMVETNSGSPAARGIVVVFDAQCLVCSRWIRFLLRHDRRALLRFATIQSDVGRQILEGAGLAVVGLETMLVLDGQRSWQQTAAILAVFHSLGWPYRLMWLFWLIPSPLRNAAYRLLARHRYRLFGRASVCMPVPAQYADRFLV